MIARGALLLAALLLPLFALAPAPMAERKVCTKCGKRRRLDKFPSNGAGRTRPECKTCYNAIKRAERTRRKRAQAAAQGVRSRRAPAPAEHRRGGPPPPSSGGRVIAWIETHCVHTKGRFRGDPFVLLDWQKALIWRLFELREMNEEERSIYGMAPGEAGLVRRYRQALVGIAKKNGKTELMAAIGLWFLIDDEEPASEIVAAASNDDQADLIFGAAKVMCELSPTLDRLTRGLRTEKEIRCHGRPGCRLYRVAAGGGGLDGQNTNVVLIDELHEWVTAKQLATYRVLTNATIGRLQPLIIQITTAGFDQETICYRQYDYGKRVVEGEIEDPEFYFVWYEAPDAGPNGRALDYRSREAFEAANPSHTAGVVTYTRFLEESRPGRKPENEVRRYNLNQWTETEAAWLPAGAWGGCVGDEEWLAGRGDAVAFVDASTKNDSTGIVWVQERDGMDVVRSRIWERPIDPRTNEPAEGWKLPIEEVKAHLRSMHYGTLIKAADATWCAEGVCVCCGEEFRPLRLRAIGYDPAFITWVAEELEEEGLPMVEVPQTNARMVPGSQGLYERVVQGRIRHDGDPALRRHVRNAIARQVEGGGWRLVKGKARRPMDGAIALAGCIYLLSTEEEQEARKPAPHVFLGEDDDVYEDG